MRLQESKGPEPGAEDISPSPEVPVTQDAQTPATQTRLRFPGLLSGEPPPPGPPGRRTRRPPRRPAPARS
jgi:hypothetical protein